MHRRLQLKKRVEKSLPFCAGAQSRARVIAFDVSKSRQAPLATMQKKRASIFVCRHDAALTLTVHDCRYRRERSRDLWRERSGESLGKNA